jgi:hypothetical protein
MALNFTIRVGRGGAGKRIGRLQPKDMAAGCPAAIVFSQIGPAWLSPAGLDERPQTTVYSEFIA